MTTINVRGHNVPVDEFSEYVTDAVCEALGVPHPGLCDPNPWWWNTRRVSGREIIRRGATRTRLPKFMDRMITK